MVVFFLYMGQLMFLGYILTYADTVMCEFLYAYTNHSMGSGQRFYSYHLTFTVHGFLAGSRVIMYDHKKKIV